MTNSEAPDLPASEADQDQHNLQMCAQKGVNKFRHKMYVIDAC